MRAKVDAFYKGQLNDAYNLFGSHLTNDGVTFTLYAPNALSVQVVGDFNNWDGSNYYMSKYDDNIFIITIKEAKEFNRYKYNILKPDNSWHLKADPYAIYSETAPNTASIIYNLNNYQFDDDNFIKKRTKNYDKPLNIYELYAGGFMKHYDNKNYSYSELGDRLIPYIKKHGYTHVEFMPLNEYPFEGSWGYQATGFFSATSRYGTPIDLMKLIDRLHQNKIGVIMDIVVVHFVKDAHGLAYFDGKAVYEYDNENANSEWGSLNFNLSKEEVRSFLISASSFWCDKYHIDGIRLDAISNVIYWGGNSNRGENIEGLNFIKRHNYEISNKFPNVMLIAEDSTSYPNVTKPTIDNGLGFDYKWDLGFMNDTLKYYSLPLDDRKDYHNLLTFSMAYFYSERFILPFSHDEVVHGKKTIIDKMWGTYQEKFALCKNLYLYMYTHPGKKLNFMGSELGMFREFDESKELDFFMLDFQSHNSFNRFIIDLNKIYLHYPILSKYDYNPENFRWLDADNNIDSVYTFTRFNKKELFIIVLNNSYKSFEEYIIDNVKNGEYYELINSEKDIYHGCNMCNFKPIKVTDGKLNIRIAPLSAMILRKR